MRLMLRCFRLCLLLPICRRFFFFRFDHFRLLPLLLPRYAIISMLFPLILPLAIMPSSLPPRRRA